MQEVFILPVHITYVLLNLFFVFWPWENSWQFSTLWCNALVWFVVLVFSKGSNHLFKIKGRGANVVRHDYAKGDEIVGTSILVCNVFSATVAQRNARHSHFPVSTYSWLLVLCFRFIVELIKFVYQLIVVFCRFWLLSRLDLLCSWFIWPASLLKALALTLLEV